MSGSAAHASRSNALDYLPVGVRGHAVRAADKRKRKPSRAASVKRRPVQLPRYLLVLDTETTTDMAQRLNFGAYRYYALSWEAEPAYERALTGWEDGPPYMILLEEGLFHADDLAERDPAGMRALRRYASSHRNRPAVDREHRLSAFGGLRLISRSEFARKLQRAAGEARACICAFNFPFDLSRLAVGYTACRTGRCAGGFSFTLAEHPDGQPNKFPPRWGVHHLGPHKAVKTLQPGRDGLRYPGNLLDLSQLVFALTAEGHSLESACDTFGVPYLKRDVEHGRISARYIDYCREDVDATACLYRATMIEHLRHPIRLSAKDSYSPASIGKAYMQSLGITPLAERGISDRVNGYAAVAYYGGRADCRIRRTPVPVQPYDFKSEYPTVCSLLDLWPLLTAERIDVGEQSPAALTRWLDRLTLDDCFAPATWHRMRAIALVEPDGDVLPVRARYSENGNGWGIGVNRYSSSEPVWYTLPDLIASKLLSGRTPKIRRVMRFEPRGRLGTLRTVKLRGVVTVDPRKRDLFRACVEARRVEGCPPELAYFLKILVNATSYGIFAEVNRPETERDETVTVHGLEQFESETPAPEEAGRHYCAPIAALITGGGRLLLAMLERSVSDLGGSYLATDTDSMAIVASRDGGLVPCPGGSHRDEKGREVVRALTWEQTDAIAARFASLNPYKRSLVPDSILALEDCATAEETGERRELWGYAISAKRYCYYTTDPDGAVAIRKASEHGLGHYLNPIDPRRRERKGKRSWIRDVWQHVVRTDALGQDVPEPNWLDRPALRQHPISTPRMLRPLEALHPELGYQEGPKPFGFMVIATPVNRRVVPSTPFALVQPYSTDPVTWAEQPWVNMHDGPGGPRYRISRVRDGLGTLAEADHDDLELFGERRNAPIRPRKGETQIPVKTFRDVLHDFITHPEHKSAAPDGSPCTFRTRGLLRHRHVALGTVTHLGKESNLLEERLAGLHYGDDNMQAEYEPRELPSTWHLAREILRARPDARIAKEAGLKRHTVAAARKDGKPRHSTRATLTHAADRIALDWYRERGEQPPRRLEGRLASYLRECGLAVCPECGGRLPSARATYCSRACRQRAYRARGAAAWQSSRRKDGMSQGVHQ